MLSRHSAQHSTQCTSGVQEHDLGGMQGGVSRGGGGLGVHLCTAKQWIRTGMKESTPYGRCHYKQLLQESNGLWSTVMDTVQHW